MTFPLASLPPGQQALIQTYFANQQKSVEGDRVKVSLTNNFSYIVPDIGAVNESDITAGNIGPARAARAAASAGHQSHFACRLCCAGAARAACGRARKRRGWRKRRVCVD